MQETAAPCVQVNKWESKLGKNVKPEGNKTLDTVESELKKNRTQLQGQVTGSLTEKRENSR